MIYYKGENRLGSLNNPFLNHNPAVSSTKQTFSNKTVISLLYYHSSLKKEIINIVFLLHKYRFFRFIYYYLSQKIP